MNISPILLLAIGSTFALAYGMIITIGWAITRKNRKIYHNAIGYSEVELFDLNSYKPLGKNIKTISLQTNSFSSNDERINIKDYEAYIVESPSQKYPELNKGDLILIDPISNKLQYAFKIPDLKNFR